MRSFWHGLGVWGVAWWGLCGTPAAQADEDWTLSGFGTVGVAKSDQPYRFQRFIDGNGTLKRDTILGAQLDARLATDWSATLQTTLAPSLRHDGQWSAEVSWAFVSWRPDNDWLLRLGKQRIPLFLSSENRDVGQTYAFARLPVEVYALSPTNDFTGASVSRTLQHGSAEWTGDLYAGRAQFHVRNATRDLGSHFDSVHTDGLGAVLTWRNANLTLRGGVHRARTERQDGRALPVRYPLVQSPMGIGGSYYQVSNALPGPGVPTTDHIVNDVINLGLDARLAPDWRVVAELARNIQHDTDLGYNTLGGYVAVLHTIGTWTPYVSLARLQTLGTPKRIWADLEAHGGQGSDALSVAQRVAADSIQMADQTALAIGVAWASGPRSQIKAEWQHTRVGARSFMIDNPPGDTIHRTHINVLSLNYSFAF